MKKCCVNCAFCVRQINNSSNTLTVEEHKQALSNNFSFIGEAKRYQQAWQLRYKQIYEDICKGKYHEQLGGGPRVLDILAKSNKPDDFTIIDPCNPIVQIFGLPPYPLAPYCDYLLCWHNLWNFANKDNEYPTLNNKNKCMFFYPYNKKGNKSFEGCEKEREALLAKSRFEITNWLVILGIFVTIMIFVIQSCSNKANYIPQENTAKQEITEAKVPQTTKNMKNSQLNENNLRSK